MSTHNDNHILTHCSELL